MTSVSYALVLRDLDGTEFSGILALPFPLTAFQPPNGTARQVKTGQRTWLYADQMTASLAVPDLLGPDPVELSGVLFVSDHGPPLNTMLNGSSGPARVALQFNIVDSAGLYIGGGLGRFPAGGGSPMTPYSLLGVQDD